MMSDTEDDDVQKTVKITIVGEPSTGKVSKVLYCFYILSIFLN